MFFNISVQVLTLSLNVHCWTPKTSGAKQLSFDFWFGILPREEKKSFLNDFITDDTHDSSPPV